VFFILIVTILISCSEQKKKVEVNKLDSLSQVQDSLLKSETKISEPPVIIYTFIKNKKANAYKHLVEKYDTVGAKIILALNRVDSKTIGRLDSLVVPDTITGYPNDYSPFPQKIDLLENVKKIIIISQNLQSYSVYEFGNLIMWGPTSTGKKSTQTPNGLFATNWKSKRTISTVNDEWILNWCFNLDNFEGVSIHEYELPGYPASHACARLLAEDAKWIYYWAEQWILTADGESVIVYGTPVIIYGDYDYKGIQPWKLLPNEAEKSKVNVETLNVEIQKHILTILKRQDEREKIVMSVIDSAIK
jgi:lipoprotein-anchoring transpeptidase ErfK/SrfK